MRPDGWVNPHDTEQDREQGKHWGRARDYEDGADAYEEALKATGVRFSEGDPVEMSYDEFDRWLGRFRNGTLVFIPEE